MRRALFLVLLLLLLPMWTGQGHGLSLLTQMGVAAMACLSYQWLWGQGGMLSFGQAVYTGAGAYLAVHLMRMADAGWPVPMVLVPLLAGLGTAFLAWVLGGISTRRPGAALAMITLGLGELAWALAPVFPSVFGGRAACQQIALPVCLWAFGKGPTLGTCMPWSACICCWPCGGLARSSIPHWVCMCGRCASKLVDWPMSGQIRIVFGGQLLFWRGALPGWPEGCRPWCLKL